jgi:hypothetical protein
VVRAAAGLEASFMPTVIEAIVLRHWVDNQRAIAVVVTSPM